jgi:hypothetical protein
VSAHQLMPMNEQVTSLLLESTPMYQNESNLNDDDKDEEKEENGRKWL